jgi:hypothetical protein
MPKPIEPAKDADDGVVRFVFSRTKAMAILTRMPQPTMMAATPVEEGAVRRPDEDAGEQTRATPVKVQGQASLKNAMRLLTTPS